MKSVAFFNNKGGVGKTTLLCNVAAYVAIYLGKRVCVIDADPQCNATQYFFDEDVLDGIYGNKTSGLTVYSYFEPLDEGEGYLEKVAVRRVHAFGVDVIPGDPRLALTEDLLAKDWADAKSGGVRGIKTNMVFANMLDQLDDYDYVFFDVSPSLGAINRAILLAADYFVSPLTIDIFSLRAFENIARWINEWHSDWEKAINNVKPKDADKVPGYEVGKARFIGYVTQQYLAKRDASGKRRAVRAYENIRSNIDDVIDDNLVVDGVPTAPYEIGTVPNLFSLVPMSQSNNKPVFELAAKDGVVGAHFAKIRDAKSIFGDVAETMLKYLK